MQTIHIVKIGGNVVDDPKSMEKFAADFAAIAGPKVLVHGGGVMASNLQKRLGQQPVMIEGRRVTDEDTLKVVTMVYAGWCSKSIVALLHSRGCHSIGLCGADANLILAVKRPPVQSDDKVIDYGFVGDVNPDDINVDFLAGLINQGITPVICAITHDGRGSLLNTNADTIASSVAIALSTKAETSLIYCFEKDGVLYDRDDNGSLVTEMDLQKYEEMKAEGRIADGMIPKIDNSFAALRAGVGEVVIKNVENLLKGKGTYLKY